MSQDESLRLSSLDCWDRCRLDVIEVGNAQPAAILSFIELAAAGASQARSSVSTPRARKLVAGVCEATLPGSRWCSGLQILRPDPVLKSRCQHLGGARRVPFVSISNQRVDNVAFSAVREAIAPAAINL